MKYCSLILFLLIAMLGRAQSYSIIGELFSPEEVEITTTQIYLKETNQFTTANAKNSFRFDSLSPGKYTITVFAEGFVSIVREVRLENKNLRLRFELKEFRSDLSTVTIETKKVNSFGISRLKPVEGTAIYAGKKSEVITVDDISANLATNNTRQIYSKVAGLNIWESDGAGIQLGIGGRGLNPNRVSNFNTRQNGYDISADALGYPESYYSPPIEAVERIEIVRGAASLQYGTQFGGFLNFKLKQAPESRKLQFVSRQTIGSFGLFNSFNSIGGNYKKLKHYTYFQYKRGDGWRPNSGFEVVNAHTRLSYQFNSKLKVGVEYTFMHYLAQQPGGLTDFLFEQDPQQSIRDRNWFRVNWNLMAATLDYRFSDRTSFNFRGFGLIAGRDAVGVLDQITRADIAGTPRDLLSDDFRNFGFENRLIHRYTIADRTSILLIGMRYYNGFTDRNQGLGSSTDEADFRYRNPNQPEDSKYEFPSQNLAFFTENIFYFTPSFSVTPGLRYEYISTNAEGYYFDRFVAGIDDTLKNDQIFENRSNSRGFLLAGIGLSFKPNDRFELYANYSQNYRSINFNDMRIDNPNYEVDPNLKDETGFSSDIGIRGNKNAWFNYDVSFFLLKYDDRIGNTLISRTNQNQVTRIVRFRTNISESISLGLESFAELNLFSLMGKKTENTNLSVFSNFSYIKAQYINSEQEAFEGNEVELVPTVIFKTGLSYQYKSFLISYQYAYTSEQYTDATNAVFTPNAVLGIIPAYSVMDLSAKYLYQKKWILESGINNLLDQRYFTRRASGYPGPGIIPSDARNVYLTIGVKL